MQSLKAFSIFDTKAEAFLTPFFSPNAATAIRTFETAVNDPSTDFNRYASDYHLFEVGAWSAATGDLTPTHPISLGIGISFLRSPDVDSNATTWPASAPSNLNRKENS